MSIWAKLSGMVRAQMKGLHDPPPSPVVLKTPPKNPNPSTTHRKFDGIYHRLIDNATRAHAAQRDLADALEAQYAKNVQPGDMWDSRQPLPESTIATNPTTLRIPPEDVIEIDKVAIPRLWKTPKQTFMAIEIIAGPYRGVVFVYDTFEVYADRKTSDGLVPVKFDVKILQSPEGFVADEAWDTFTRSFLFMFLTYLNTQEVGRFANAPTKGIH